MPAAVSDAARCRRSSQLKASPKKRERAQRSAGTSVARRWSARVASVCGRM
jgi:hypothetical protein